MYKDHTIGVVVPVYNEVGFIGNVIQSMPDFVDRMYIVDDGSTDGSWDEIVTSARKDAKQTDILDKKEPPFEQTITDGGTIQNRAIIHDQIGRVVPIEHRQNRGAGGAIKTGYMVALEDKIDIISTVDGDGQMDLSQLTRLLNPIVEDRAEYAKGNRLLYREYREDMPTFRFIGNSILTFLTKIASGYWKTMDPQNGYTAISYYALNNVGIKAMYEYYGYCNNLLVKLNAKGMRVADVAMPAVYGDEESDIKYVSYIRKVSMMLLKSFLWRLKVKYLVLDFHPLALFYLFGLTTIILGLLGSSWSLYAKIILGDPFFVRGSLSIMLLLLGSLFLMFAMLFDMQVNKEKEIQIHD